MAIQRLDHVGIVVEDLDAATAFFVELGMELDGEGTVEGDWVDRVNGIDGVRVEMAMLRTPDGHSKVELTRFLAPALTESASNQPPNTLGLRNLMFAVDDIHDAVARLKSRGAELVGTIEQFDNIYLLCYLRGPAGIIVALAEQIA